MEANEKRAEIVVTIEGVERLAVFRMSTLMECAKAFGEKNVRGLFDRFDAARSGKPDAFGVEEAMTLMAIALRRGGWAEATSETVADTIGLDGVVWLFEELARGLSASSRGAAKPEAATPADPRRPPPTTSPST